MNAPEIYFLNNISFYFFKNIYFINIILENDERMFYIGTMKSKIVGRLKEQKRDVLQYRLAHITC